MYSFIHCINLRQAKRNKNFKVNFMATIKMKSVYKNTVSLRFWV